MPSYFVNGSCVYTPDEVPVALLASFVWVNNQTLIGNAVVSRPMFVEAIDADTFALVHGPGFSTAVLRVVYRYDAFEVSSCPVAVPGQEFQAAWPDLFPLAATALGLACCYAFLRSLA